MHRGRPAYTIVRMPLHNHLDQGVRDEGECPGCDAVWKAQRERLVRTQKVTRAVRELDHMADRPPPPPRAFCSALRETGRETHTCIRDRDHGGKHHCPTCDQDWS